MTSREYLEMKLPHAYTCEQYHRHDGPHWVCACSRREVLAKWDEMEEAAHKYRAWMEVRSRAGRKDGTPCACVWAWEGDELLHECAAHAERRKALEEEIIELRGRPCPYCHTPRPSYGKCWTTLGGKR